ncbi:MAG: cell division protein FtsQ/DivIB [Planktomarina sp.]
MQPIAGQFHTIRAVRPGPVRPRSSDPAPSKLEYRVQRWTLTPAVRTFLKVGLPVAAVLTFVGAFATNDAAMTALQTKVSEAQQSVSARPEYRFDAMQFQGASPALQAEITAALGLQFPISGLHLDLEMLQAKAKTVAAVDTVLISLAPGGQLNVQVTEVPAVALWRSKDGLALLSQNGDVLRYIEDRSQYVHLPLVAGEGAPAHLGAVGAILDELSEIKGDVRGLIWVSERRWDIALSHGRMIHLPENGALQALQQIMVLQQTRGLLDRDIAAVDYRYPARPVVRLTPAALEQLRAGRGISIEGIVQ